MQREIIFNEDEEEWSDLVVLWFEVTWKMHETTQTWDENSWIVHVLWYSEALVPIWWECYPKERMLLSATNTDAGCEIQGEKSRFVSIRWSVVVSKRLPEGRNSEEIVKNTKNSRNQSIIPKKGKTKLMEITNSSSNMCWGWAAGVYTGSGCWIPFRVGLSWPKKTKLDSFLNPYFPAKFLTQHPVPPLQVSSAALESRTNCSAMLTPLKLGSEEGKRHYMNFKPQVRTLGSSL